MVVQLSWQIAKLFFENLRSKSSQLGLEPVTGMFLLVLTMVDCFIATLIIYFE